MFPSFPPPQSRGRARTPGAEEPLRAADRSYGVAVAEQPTVRLRPATPEGLRARGSLYDGIVFLLVWVMFGVSLVPIAAVQSPMLGYFGLGYAIFTSLALMYLANGAGFRVLAFHCLLFTALGFACGYVTNRLFNQDLDSPEYPTEGISWFAFVISFSTAGGAFLLVPILMGGLFYFLNLPLTTQSPGPQWHKDTADMMLAGMALNAHGVYPREFVSKILEGHVHFSGEAYLDYVQFVGSNHTFLGLLITHKAHPLSRFERIFVLIIEILLSVPPVAVMHIQFGALPDWLRAALVAVVVTLPQNIIVTLLINVSEWDAEIELEDEQNVSQDAGRVKRALFAELAIFVFFLAFSGGTAVFCVWFIKHHSDTWWVKELCHHADTLGFIFIMQLLLPVVMPGRHKETGSWYLGFFGRWAVERFYDDEYARAQPLPSLRKAGRTRSREPWRL